MVRLVPQPTTSSVFSSASAARMMNSTSMASRGLRLSAIGAAPLFRRGRRRRGTCEGRHDIAGEAAQLRNAAGDDHEDMVHPCPLQIFEHGGNLVRRAVKRVLLGAVGFVGVGKDM